MWKVKCDGSCRLRLRPDALRRVGNGYIVSKAKNSGCGTLTVYECDSDGTVTTDILVPRSWIWSATRAATMAIGGDVFAIPGEPS
jgi:hypothetical protein